MSSNYSRIIFIIIYFEDPMPRCIMQTKTTYLAVAVYPHHTATRGSCILSKMAAVNIVALMMTNYRTKETRRAKTANPFLPAQDVQENLPDLRSPINTLEDPQDAEEEVDHREGPENGEGSKGDDDTVL